MGDPVTDAGLSLGALQMFGNKGGSSQNMSIPSILPGGNRKYIDNVIGQMNSTLSNSLNQALGYVNDYTQKGIGQQKESLQDALGNLSTSLNNASQAYNTGLQTSQKNLMDYLNSATNAAQSNMQQGYNNYMAATAPYRNSGYAAHDAYMDSLGLARPAIGSQSLATYMQQINDPSSEYSKLLASLKESGQAYNGSNLFQTPNAPNAPNLPGQPTLNNAQLQQALQDALNQKNSALGGLKSPSNQSVTDDAIRQYINSNIVQNQNQWNNINSGRGFDKGEYNTLSPALQAVTSQYLKQIGGQHAGQPTTQSGAVFNQLLQDYARQQLQPGINSANQSAQSAYQNQLGGINSAYEAAVKAANQQYNQPMTDWQNQVNQMNNDYNKQQGLFGAFTGAQGNIMNYLNANGGGNAMGIFSALANQSGRNAPAQMINVGVGGRVI